jgi:hypothetical protein
MPNPLFPKFNQAQQVRQKVQESLNRLKRLSTRTEPQARQQILQETQRLRQSLRGADANLDRNLHQLTEAATNLLKNPSTTLGKALAGLMGLLGKKNQPQQKPELASLVDKAATLIEQLSPQLFGGQNRTPEQAGGVLAAPPAPRRIIPAEPDTWQGMRLIGDNRVEIRTSNFRGRYYIDDPAITGKMQPVRSSNVHSIGFQMNLQNPMRSTLFVKYLQTYGNKGVKGSGPTYGYKNVPPQVFQSFLAANSKGKFVWDQLRIRGTVAGAQYEYYLDSISRGYVPRRAVIENGIQILKRRKRQEAKSGRTVISQLRERVIGPYRPPRGSPVNRGNPDRGSRRPNRGR